MDLNLHNSRTLFTVLFLISYPNWPPHPTPNPNTSFRLAGDDILGGGLSPLGSCSAFLGLYSVCRRSVSYSSSVCFSPVNMSFITGGLSQEPRRGEGNFSFLTTLSNVY